MKEFVSQYKLPLIFGGLGLILAILFISIGFFKTLLIILLTALGAFLGHYLEKNGVIPAIFKQQNKS
ncbi:DUF2273 domain-containing protein [Enterococcus canintestini]|uniref:Small integral membrane protein n=1 Tax=Enterococcus canintestini TaxID=317010 RepID=A0A267HQZ1_9ENTE|nr:DUF2273 domain-containing protein [Enterococcus canintestini]PAB00764.1 hypothetical protein AKL21_05780 [Enterococcus canintestini]